MSASKRWVEDFIDKTAALMVVASGYEYDHSSMEDIAQECLEDACYDMTKFDINQVVGVSMERDW